MKKVLVETFGAQTPQHDVGPTTAADHADVAWTRAQRSAHALFIFVVAARNNGDEDLTSRPNCCRDRAFPVLGEHEFDGDVSETVAGDEIGSIIDERHAVAQQASQPRKTRSDVSGPANDDARRRRDAFEEQSHPLPNAQVGGELFDAKGLRLRSGKKKALGLPHRRTVQSCIAEVASDVTIFGDKQFLPDVSRSMNDGDERGEKSSLERFCDVICKSALFHFHRRAASVRSVPSGRKRCSASPTRRKNQSGPMNK